MKRDRAKLFELETFGRDDRVLTPSGEIARVLRTRPDGRLELEYDEALRADHGALVLHPKLLRKIDPNKRPPRPVRIR